MYYPCCGMLRFAQNQHPSRLQPGSRLQIHEFPPRPFVDLHLFISTCMLVRIPEDVRSALFPHPIRISIRYSLSSSSTSSHPSPLNQITQHSGAMRDATEERLRLDARHNHEFLRFGKTQKQKTTAHCPNLSPSHASIANQTHARYRAQS